MVLHYYCMNPVGRALPLRRKLRQLNALEAGKLRQLNALEAGNLGWQSMPAPMHPQPSSPSVPHLVGAALDGGRELGEVVSKNVLLPSHMAACVGGIIHSHHPRRFLTAAKRCRASRPTASAISCLRPALTLEWYVLHNALLYVALYLVRHGFAALVVIQVYPAHTCTQYATVVSTLCCSDVLLH